MRLIRRSLTCLGIGQVGAASAVAASLSMLLTITAARVLSTSDYGHFAFLLATALLCASLFDLGVSVHAVTAHPVREGAGARRTLGTYLAAQLLSYSIAGPCAMAVMWAVGDVHNMVLIVSVGLATVAIGLQTFVAALYQARQLWGARSSWGIFLNSARTIPPIVALLVTRDLALAALMMAIGSWMSLGAFSLSPLARHHLGHLSRRDVVEVPALWRDARWYAFGGLIGSTSGFAPIGLAAAFGGAQEVAQLGLAVSLGAGGALLLNAGMVTLLPQAATPSLPIRTYFGIYRRTVSLLLYGMILYAVVAGIGLPLVFGPSYAASVVPFLLVTAGQAVLIAANPLQFVLYREGRARFLSVLDLVQAVIVIGTAPLLSVWTSWAAAGPTALLFGIVVSRAIGLVALVRKARPVVLTASLTQHG